jgi:predicted nucleic acid-binding protein
MKLVLDTNILIAALIKNSFTRKCFFSPEIEFYLPEYALEEVTKHRAKIARHSRLSDKEIDLLLTLLLESVTVVPAEKILPHLKAAEALIGDVDKNDVPFVALALAVENDGIGRMTMPLKIYQGSPFGKPRISKPTWTSDHEVAAAFLPISVTRNP